MVMHCWKNKMTWWLSRQRNVAEGVTNSIFVLRNMFYPLFMFKCEPKDDIKQITVLALYILINLYLNGFVWDNPFSCKAEIELVEMSKLIAILKIDDKSNETL